MAVFSGTLGSWPSESSLWREFSIDASGAGAGARGENTRRAVRRVLSRTDDVMSSTNVAPRRKFDRPVVGDRYGKFRGSADVSGCTQRGKSASR